MYCQHFQDFITITTKTAKLARRAALSKLNQIGLLVLFLVFLHHHSDYSPGQARGGSDDGILSTSVHRKGFGMKLSARASSLYVQTVPKDGRIIGRFSYCFQHGEGIVNPTCCLCHAALNLIPLFITVILLFIIYCSNSRYFAYNSSKYRLHLYLLMFCRSVPMQYIKNDEYQSR